MVLQRRSCRNRLQRERGELRAQPKKQHARTTTVKVLHCKWRNSERPLKTYDEIAVLSAEVDRLAAEGGELRARLQSMRAPKDSKPGEPAQFRKSVDELQLTHLLDTCFGPTWVVKESASKKDKMRHFVSSTDPGIRLNVEALKMFSDMVRGY